MPKEFEASHADLTMVWAELDAGPSAAGYMPGGSQPGAHLQDTGLTQTNPWAAP